MNGTNILATGLVIDGQKDGTLFPSAGGNSADSRVQATYWRCVIALFASARMSNPALHLVLFCNTAPPVLDGVNLAATLDRYGVELRQIPLSTRLARGRTSAWGNVLYVFDILASLEEEPGNTALALVDSDVLVMQPLDVLFERIRHSEMVGYQVDSAMDAPINGMTLRSLADAARGLDPAADRQPRHLGGELFGITLAKWKEHRAIFSAILDQARRGSGPAAGVLTEEHVFTIAAMQIGLGVRDANDLIKRIWTSPYHSTIQPGDEKLAMWHLPAEKRYGLADLYRWLASAGFSTALEQSAFRRKAMALCGVPTKSVAKIASDGVRQIAARLRTAL